MERSANCHVDALSLAWALASDLPGCFAGRRPAIPDQASLTFPPPAAEAALQRSLRLNMQATKKRHPYNLALTPCPASASSSSPYRITFRPSSPASVAVSGAFVLAPSKYRTCTLTMTARISTGGGATSSTSTATATAGADSSAAMTRAVYFQALAGGKSAWGKASTNVDVAAEHVLAWLWHGESYEQLDAFVESDGDSMSMSLEVPGSHSRLSVFGNKLPLIDDRVFATWNAWERARNDDFVVAFGQHTDFPDEFYKNKIDNAITNHKGAAKAVKGSL
ncbi:hypothetical protein TeGR_g9555, partial [Tetraparma gracilis]